MDFVDANLEKFRGVLDRRDYFWTIAMPIILIVAVSLLVSLVLADIFAQDVASKMQGALDRAPEMQIIRPAAFFFQLLMMLAHVLVVLITGLFLVKMVFGPEIRIGHCLSLLLLGELIYAVGWLLTVPLILYKGDIDASWSLPTFCKWLSFGHESLVFIIASRITLFVILEAVFLAEAVKIVFCKQPAKSYFFSILVMSIPTVLLFLIKFLIKH
ncbi:MAG: hypothetical protein V1668_03285 [Patescibacteria group bacterium]